MISDLDIDITLLIVLINGNIQELTENGMECDTTTAEVRTQLHELCRIYLNGNWTKVDRNDIDISEVE